MDLPPGFEKGNKRKTCKLKKSLYGLKQSPRAWFERFTKSIKIYGFTQGQADHTMVFKHSAGGKIIVLIVYVDGIILMGDNIEEQEQVNKVLAKEFEIKELDQLRHFLKMEVGSTKRGMTISQRKYTLG